MIRETTTDPAGKKPNTLDAVLEEAILERVRELAERLAEEREVMSPQEAADFLRMPYHSFKKIAPTIKRVPVSSQRFVYLREDLVAWLKANRVG